jgi:hypothetical protein
MEENGQPVVVDTFEMESLEVDRNGNVIIVILDEDQTSPDPRPNLDLDGDGIINTQDNCPNKSNPYQADTDRDGIGNVCDNTPNGNNVAKGCSPPPGLETKNLPPRRFMVNFKPGASYAFRFKGDRVKGLKIIWHDVATGSRHTNKLITISPCAGQFSADKLPPRCSTNNYTSTMYLSTDKKVSYACAIDPTLVYYLNIKVTNNQPSSAVVETSL